jgi:hypothetical protein
LGLGFKKDPSPIFPILEILKADREDYVRRSVANNLNDISKDHPEKVIELVKRWKGHGKETDWIIKHACRTLLKQGRQEVMEIFGFAPPDAIKVSALNFGTDRVQIGQSLNFRCKLKSKGNKLGKLRLEYVVHFIKSNGQPSPKVFQISERVEEAGELEVQKRHSFADLSTRKHFPGVHKFELRVNGVVKAKGSVEVEA